jgi:putative transposase
MPTPAQHRRAAVDQAVADALELSGKTYGSPPIHADLVVDGWRVGEKAVAKSLARQDLAARSKKRREGLTRPDKRKQPFPGPVKRDVSAAHECETVRGHQASSRTRSARKSSQVR